MYGIGVDFIYFLYPANTAPIILELESIPSGILKERSVACLLYCGAVDVPANALAIFSSISDRFFEYFCKTGSNPSIITSCDASLNNNEVSKEREVVRSSKVLAGGSLVTPRNLPRR